MMFLGFLFGHSIFRGMESDPGPCIVAIVLSMVNVKLDDKLKLKKPIRRCDFDTWNSIVTQLFKTHLYHDDIITTANLTSHRSSVKR